MLSETGVQVHPDVFALISVSRSDWADLLSNNALSPSGDSPFLIFSEENEVTLVLGSADLQRIRPGLAQARVSEGYRLITFTVEMDLSVVGFMASVAGVLADADVPILPLSSFSRDHLLIRQGDLATALKALGPHIRELC